MFFERIAGLSPESLDPGVRHAYYAAEATLHSLLQTPNPHADAWASSYLGFESAQVVNVDKPAALGALSVSEQRARDTIDRQSLARAVSQFMTGPLEENRRKAVQDVVAKAGYPDLIELIEA